jgi:hypothetical protein
MGKRNRVVVSYLDDFLCIAETESECLSVHQMLIELVQRLGFEVNWKKESLPSQEIVFLGVEINSVTRRLALPDAKFVELQELVLKWSHKTRTSKIDLQRFLGKLNWACRVIRGGRTFVRRLQDLLCRVSESHHHVRINAAAKQDISWWLEGLSYFNGSCSFVCDVVLPSFEFESPMSGLISNSTPYV